MTPAPWLIVRYKNPSEKLCLTLFGKMGVESYLPRTGITITHARSSKEVERPLFPGYMFLRDDGSYDRVGVEYMTGIVGVVRNGQRAFARLADEVISKMRRSENAAGLIVIPDAPLRGKLSGTKPGDTVRVLSGGEWWMGKFMGMKATDRITVLLHIFGSSREQVVGLHQVEKALQ